jgi:poly-gamma-glutamate capsule biosynthesis protein CapA/YwtB (metallophosphatase superfamily)
MTNKEMTFAATGDSFITRRLPSVESNSFKEISELLKSADVRFTNLETTLHYKEGYPSAFSGGTWAMSPPEVLKDINAYGFNLLAWANNHTMDYSYGGLLATKRYLNEYNFVHAGAGENLSEASSPEYLETPSGRVALVSITSTFYESNYAGDQRPDISGRPGINPLRYETTYFVTQEEMEQLSKIAEKTGINAEKNLSIQEGFDSKDENDALTFGQYDFKKGPEIKKVTHPLAIDMKRLKDAISEARRQADIVLVSIHSHEMENDEKSVPSQFLVEASREAINTGADAVIGHGPHVLRGIEIYHHKPIFYSLGNFIFQNDTVPVLPSDFYDKYGLDKNANMSDALDKRSKNNTIGLGTNKNVWESVIAVWESQNGELASLKLFPVKLGFGLARYQRGWPTLSKDESILKQLQKLSEPFGTKISINNGVGTISI